MSKYVGRGGPGPQHPWPGLEVRHLAALEALSREGSFRGAAEALGYVQSAVSQQIAALERAVGTRLVERSRGQRGIVLTEAGQLMVEHGAEVMKRLRAARADLAGLSGEGPGLLRVGVEQSLAPALLPALFRSLERIEAGPRVDFSDLDGERELTARLESGELDAAIGDVPSACAALAGDRIFTDPWVLVVSSESPLARRPEPPTLRELAGLSLVAVTQSRGADQLRAAAAHEGVDLAFTMQTHVGALGRALAASGIGAAIGPRLALQPLAAELVAIDLSELLAPRVVALCWRSDRLRAPGLDRFKEAVAGAVRAAGLAPAARRERPVAHVA